MIIASEDGDVKKLVTGPRRDLFLVILGPLVLTFWGSMVDYGIH